MEITSDSLQKTKKIGEELAKEVLKTKNERALIFGLSGDLGTGKTSFIQGFAKGFKIKEKILSPTFVIMKRFEIKDPKIKKNFKALYHLDCYRIEKAKEILDLGFLEIISDPKNIIIVEWIDRIKKLIPDNFFEMEFDFINENTRKIKIKYLKNR